MTSAAVLARWRPDNPLLEVVSWMAVVLGGLAVLAAVLAWFGDRAWARRYPYDLQLSLHTATGDPGHVVFILDLGRVRLPRIVSESRVQLDALDEVADWDGALDPMLRIEAVEFCYLRTILQPEGLVPKPLMDRYVVSDPWESASLYRWVERAGHPGRERCVVSHFGADVVNAAA